MKNKEEKTTTGLTSSLREALRRDDSFSHFDLCLAPAALRDHERMAVKKHGSYDNFGRLDSLRKDTARFIESIGNRPGLAARVGAQVDGMVRGITAAFNAQSAWVSLRASFPLAEYDIPRWHQDGWFFEPGEEENEQRKVVAALKGAPTLIAGLPPALRNTFNSLYNPEEGIENRKALAGLVGSRWTTTAKPGEGSVFVVGPGDRAALHSEPPIHAPRLFLSAVPGTAFQVEELRRRWGCPPVSFSRLS